MSTDQVSILFALLALGALALGAATLTGSLIVGVAQRLMRWRSLMSPAALAIAAAATAGSLYYSEVAGYPPCELCWYQRICMYPLVAIFGVALLRRDNTRAGWYALPLAVVGLGLSAYHYRLQLSGGQGSFCDIAAPCDYRWVNTFGFVSIPFMAGCGFIAITGLVALTLKTPYGPDRTNRQASYGDR